MSSYFKASVFRGLCVLFMEVIDAGKNRVQREDLNLCGLPREDVLRGRSTSAFDARDFTKKTVAANSVGFFLVLLGVIIRHFPRGVFWISDVLARIY